MRYLITSFLKGLLIVLPFFITGYTVYVLIRFVDGLVPAKTPGLGILITVTALTLVGIVASNAVGRRVLKMIDQAIDHLPVVKLVYSSIKDLLGAFVGDRKSFDKPVMVDILGDGKCRAFGFITCSQFDDPKLKDHVAVYLPQSYNFAGNLLIVHRDRTEHVDADSAQFMAFIVSGGVGSMTAARTVMEGKSPLLTHS